jgi:hypothetical protein
MEHILSWLLVVVVFAVFAYSAHWTGGLTQGLKAFAIRLVGVGSAFGAAFLLWSALLPGEATLVHTFDGIGDEVSLPSSGPGSVLIQALLPEEEETPGKAVIVEVIAPGENEQEPMDVTFVLVDESVEYEQDEPGAKARLQHSSGVADLGADPRLKLKDLRPPDVVQIEVSWFPRLVDAEALAWLLIILACLGALLEAAVPNGSARTFLTVTMAMAAFLGWSIQDGLVPDGALLAAFVAMVWAFVKGAVVGSLVPGFLARFISPPQEPETVDDEDETTEKEGADASV